MTDSHCQIRVEQVVFGSRIGVIGLQSVVLAEAFFRCGNERVVFAAVPRAVNSLSRAAIRRDEPSLRTRLEGKIGDSKTENVANIAVSVARTHGEITGDLSLNSKGQRVVVRSLEWLRDLDAILKGSGEVLA